MIPKPIKDDEEKTKIYSFVYFVLSVKFNFYKWGKNRRGEEKRIISFKII